MLKTVFDGWNIFKKKAFLVKALIITAIGILYTWWISNYVNNTIINISNTIPNGPLISMVSNIFHTLGWNLVWMILLLFVSLFIASYLTYIIALSERKGKTQNTFSKVFNYTLITYVILIAISLILLLLLSFVNVFTLILLFIFGIFLIPVSFVLNIAIIELGLEKNTLTEAFHASWLFIKRRFWLTLGFIILLLIVVAIIYYIVGVLYEFFFYYSETIRLIINLILSLIIPIYAINTAILFVKKYRKK